MKKLIDLTTKEIEKKYGKHFRKAKAADDIPDGVKLVVYVDDLGLVKNVTKRELGLRMFAVSHYIEVAELEKIRKRGKIGKYTPAADRGSNGAAHYMKARLPITQRKPKCAGCKPRNQPHKVVSPMDDTNTLGGRLSRSIKD